MSTATAQTTALTEDVEVLVVDDHRTFAEAMCIAVNSQPGLRCRRAVPSAEAALVSLDDEGCPDVVLLDVNLPGMDGVTAIGAIRARCPRARIILLTADTTAQTLIRAVDAGAHGFLPKSFPFTRVLHAVQRVEHDVVAEPLSLERALRYATETAADHAEASVDLTERERQILVLLAEGLPVKHVASRLHMSVHTCRGHIASLLRKFDVHSQLAAVIAAARLGLLPNLRVAPDANPRP